MRKIHHSRWFSQLLWGLLCGAVWTISASAQIDTTRSLPKVSIARLAIPSVFIATGLYTLSDNHSFNRYRIRGEILDNTNGYRTHLDDYLSVGPTVLLAGLTAAGVRGRSTPLDRAGLWLVASGIAGVVTYGLKTTTHYTRPDGSDNQSFPSAHTAFAFAGAGVLDREFGRTSVLIPVAGYAMAGTTGYLRLVNDQHWVSDVLVGAAIGLLSAEASYRLYPWLKRKLTRRRYAIKRY